VDNSKKLNIGFVTIWFERGQAYVTKTIRDQIDQIHNTFIFARTGGVHGQLKLETKGNWNVPNLTTHDSYAISHDVMRNWIEEHNLDAVVFNEEYDWGLVKCCRDMGVKVLTYLDYYKDEWQDFMHLYDGVLCSSRRAYDLVKDKCNALFMGWGVDTSIFQPAENTKDAATFYHNAGWYGIGFRKMTPAAILAFDALNKVYPQISLFVHSQGELEKLPPGIIEIVRKNKNIEFHVETVPAPGLYHKGRVFLFPTKLEGLGLPLMEAFACGMPALVTDAAPMHEFVESGSNGILVQVAHQLTREDNIAFPEEIIDVNDLAMKMSIFIENPSLIESMGENARRYATEKISLAGFSRRVHSCFAEVLGKGVTT